MYECYDIKRTNKLIKCTQNNFKITFVVSQKIVYLAW